MEVYYLQGWALFAEKFLQIGMLLFIVWNIKLLVFEKVTSTEGDGVNGNE
ncbi:TrbL/VirB6 plasmid conjugal transfer protein [Sporosarcina newyorkensis 2681]|uniref:TrbL/VirB6 plasmid conjugal transfer protein n=1 Tax=Sporosarcina newyorkensis 2681 TaxID=1027292 RepID=F9DXG3_9BACL|nr:hypothetical protein [Sporosarcina newyorkensis]EGQ20746.1 TrbL/VirB6 plasmid conjugal transfer protein [Sporosarcina newyorkensis 2681]